MIREEAILDNVEATLRSITRANQYLVDVERVERVIRLECDKNQKNRPWLGFARIDRPVPRPDYFQIGCVRIELYILIQILVGPQSGEERTRVLSRTWDGIFAAMHKDNTRGGLAIDTLLFEGPISNEASPVSTPLGSGMMLSTWRVRYDRDTTGNSVV